MHQKLVSMLSAKRNYDKRVKKYSFVVWRSYAVFLKQEGKEAMLARLICKRLNYKA